MARRRKYKSTFAGYKEKIVFDNSIIYVHEENKVSIDGRLPDDAICQLIVIWSKVFYASISLKTYLEHASAAREMQDARARE